MLEYAIYSMEIFFFLAPSVFLFLRPNGLGREKEGNKKEGVYKKKSFSFQQLFPVPHHYNLSSTFVCDCMACIYVRACVCVKHIRYVGFASLIYSADVTYSPICVYSYKTLIRNYVHVYVCVYN